ncbi:MAG: hypothetical protein N2487_04865 [Verrucomicrobiae bacterium]|nr:hypothetical protein [Verrucomicrobiae bacterium]
MKTRLNYLFIFVLCFALLSCVSGVEELLTAEYLTLTTRESQPPPFNLVKIKRGPTVRLGVEWFNWFEFSVFKEETTANPPLCVIRILCKNDPLDHPPKPLLIRRYQLWIPETSERLEYIKKRERAPLLPCWNDFELQFIPRASEYADYLNDFPKTALFLGHVLTLRATRKSTEWEEWKDARTLELDNELLIGTSRPFKDSEGKRLPQQPKKQDYHYVDFTETDYRTMIEIGVNLFTVKPAQEQYVRGEPVFYIRQAGGNPTLRYPADLFRANYLGPVMFIDEPTIIMIGDTNIHRRLKYFTDAAELIEKRTRLVYSSSGSYGSARLEKSLLDMGINLGDLCLRHYDYPSWETLYETAFYQLKSGAAGIVHEGRYNLEWFNSRIVKFSETAKFKNTEELLKYHYAYLRGAARAFNKHWGTAIYGQCDTNIAPLALTIAYDMGARYLWFWTSDHDHHVPWNEQMELVRHLRHHERLHPRSSIFGPLKKIDVAIVIPKGMFVSLEDLWWVREMDKEGKNESSIAYKRLVKNTLETVRYCLDRRLSFDILPDESEKIRGYGQIIRIKW